MKKFKKVWLIVGFLILVFVFLFLFSTFKYQQLVNEGSVVADKQCLYVNPLIIKRKESYVKFINVYFVKGDKKYGSEINNYLSTSKKYIKEQEKWLKEQYLYMSRRDFIMFMPTQFKALGKLQYISREAEMKSIQAIVKAIESRDANYQKKYLKVVTDQTEIANTANKESSRLSKSKQSFDPRTSFVKFPKTKCTKENLNIPTVPNPFITPKLIYNNPLTFYRKTI